MDTNGTGTRHTDPPTVALSSAPAPNVADALPTLPLTYSRQQLADALGMSVATLDRNDAAGRLPASIKIGGRKVWLRETIMEWLRLGAPDRKAFEAHQAAKRGRR